MTADLGFLSTIGIGSITLATILPALLVLAVCVIAVKLIMKIVNGVLERSPVERGMHTFISSVIRIVLYVLAGLIVADALGIPVTSLVAALSVVGVAVSLAVQGSLSNVAGGVMLLVTKPFSAGDYVEAGGVSGTVSEVGIAYTEIVTPDNKVIYCPNSEISAAKIINYTSADERRVDVTVGVSYDCGINEVREALLRCAKNHRADMIEGKEPFAAVLSYQDHCIEYTLRIWVRTDRYWDVYFALLQEVKEEFDASSISMTYPHVNVHIVENKQ